jgi:hypothetical protein
MLPATATNDLDILRPLVFTIVVSAAVVVVDFGISGRAKRIAVQYLAANVVDTLTLTFRADCLGFVVFGRTFTIKVSGHNFSMMVISNSIVQIVIASRVGLEFADLARVVQVADG